MAKQNKEKSRCRDSPLLVLLGLGSYPYLVFCCTIGQRLVVTVKPMTQLSDAPFSASQLIDKDPLTLADRKETQDPWIPGTALIHDVRDRSTSTVNGKQDNIGGTPNNGDEANNNKLNNNNE
ncbi:hypothetical protein M422DRAFT_266471 [Sphaerobolus stellatus SS14]|uniref:Uncharacterized protein n=1 Tax=Sphaerobolus stellatus (strain SS14) TaxID=990650 RepID=A0A0C9V2X2_SPHS4|nr:hypothetical protein M422DRAFT_266471 [Sphaerobolus stellatus SS14]